MPVNDCCIKIFDGLQPIVTLAVLNPESAPKTLRNWLCTGRAYRPSPAVHCRSIHSSPQARRADYAATATGYVHKILTIFFTHHTGTTAVAKSGEHWAATAAQELPLLVHWLLPLCHGFLSTGLDFFLCQCVSPFRTSNTAHHVMHYTKGVEREDILHTSCRDPGHTRPPNHTRHDMMNG